MEFPGSRFFGWSEKHVRKGWLQFCLQGGICREDYKVCARRMWSMKTCASLQSAASRRSRSCYYFKFHDVKSFYKSEMSPAPRCVSQFFCFRIKTIVKRCCLWYCFCNNEQNLGIEACDCGFQIFIFKWIEATWATQLRPRKGTLQRVVSNKVYKVTRICPTVPF